jgi:hypothetical protein
MSYEYELRAASDKLKVALRRLPEVEREEARGKNELDRAHEKLSEAKRDLDKAQQKYQAAELEVHKVQQRQALLAEEKAKHAKDVAELTARTAELTRKAEAEHSLKK